MSDSDIQMELTLELAHGASEPSAADAARNLAALRARLGLPAPATGMPAGTGASVESGSGAAASGTGAETSGAAMIAPPTGAVPLGAGSSSLGRWLSARVVTASALTGVAGFLLGLLVAAPAPERRATSMPLPRDSAAVRGELDPAPAVSAAQAPASAEAPNAGSPDIMLPDIGVPNAEPSGSAVATSPAPRAHRVASRARAHGASSSRPAQTEPDFLEAVRWLRRAQRAVRRNEPALALSLLDELDARFPRELLGEERAATRALGLCGVDQVDRARALARDLLAHNPRSIYAERLRASCAASALDGAPENRQAPRE